MAVRRCGALYPLRPNALNERILINAWQFVQQGRNQFPQRVTPTCLLGTTSVPDRRLWHRLPSLAFVDQFQEDLA